MILYICKTCGFFRDMTYVSGLMSITIENMVRPVRYNTTVTYCPNGHGLMYQVQEGDRLSVLPVVAEDEKEGMNG